MKDFLGTFNRSQFERLVAFARSQLTSIESRILHLQAERGRIGVLTFTFGADHVPEKVTANPSDSYLGKLLAAYEVLGGNPFFDLRTRNRDQPVFVVRGTEDNPAVTMSNGEPIPSKGFQDAFSAELIRALREPFEQAIDFRCCFLERKIRRALDYSDELANEVIKLQTMQAAATTEGSLEFVSNQIQQLFGDRNYRAIFDDSNADPTGLTTYAPFSQYDVETSRDPAIGGPDREVNRPQRQDSGFVGPGRRSTT